MRAHFLTTSRAGLSMLMGLAGAGLILAGAIAPAAAQQPPPGLAAKQAQSAHMSQVIATARRVPSPAKPAHPQQPLAEPAPVWVTGIRDRTGTPPLPATQFQSTNAWFGLQNGHHIIVFAGVAAADANQGELVVWVPDQAPTVHIAPVQQGAIRITAADTDVLTVTTARGTQLRFDVAAARFL